MEVEGSQGEEECYSTFEVGRSSDTDSSGWSWGWGGPESKRWTPVWIWSLCVSRNTRPPRGVHTPRVQVVPRPPFVGRTDVGLLPFFFLILRRGSRRRPGPDVDSVREGWVRSTTQGRPICRHRRRRLREDDRQ